MSQALPGWAIVRVAAALDAQETSIGRTLSPGDLARRTGLSKSLARRCLAQLHNRDERRRNSTYSIWDERPDRDFTRPSRSLPL